MNIQGLNKANVLAALYNAARAQGRGVLRNDPKPMTTEAAQKCLDDNPGQYFDYLIGRVMKIDLSGDEVDTYLYNRDNGVGAAERAIESIR